MRNRQFFCCPYYLKQVQYRSYISAKSRNKVQKFAPFSGTVIRIEDFYPDESASAGCYKLMSLENKNKEPVNFVIWPQTYFVDHEVIKVGDKVTGFYDANAPAILIYPPQYPAIVMAKNKKYQNVVVDYFNKDLVSSNGNLKLNIAPNTKVILTNNQPFSKYPGNRNLVVVYGSTTKSIPAQTTPDEVIVLC
ncbi:hypothetical protein [Clostridium hydrogenum]|uniref:hypothetical protein n=1 Tax=Clostridium hydrogenum TaxID=2855764 RepID=UPI001F20E84A|nr:hypothetical protein [Clostridium hydrogenum]